MTESSTGDRIRPARGFPLTTQQERLWTRRHDRPCDRCVLTLRGTLDEAALRRAVGSVAGRHSALGTEVLQRPGLRFPLQSIATQREPRFESVGWEGGVPEGPILADLPGAGSRDTGGGDPRFTPGPPLAVTLRQRSPEEHVLSLQVDSLWSDLRSLENLVRDLFAEYDAIVEGRRSPGDEPVQYLEFARWLQNLPEEEDLEPAEAYWSRRLEAAAPDHPLPFERSAPPAGAEVTIDRVRIPLDASTAPALAALARSSGLAPAALVSGAWRILLWRLGGRLGLATAELVDGRPFEELEGAVGRFSFLVPVPVPISPRGSFLDQCQRIEEVRAEAAEWQDSYAALRNRWAGSEPRAAVGHAAFPAALDACGLEIAVQGVRVELEPVALALHGVTVGDRFGLDLRYDARRFSHVAAGRLAAMVGAILDGAVAAPESPAESLPTLDAASRHVGVVELNDTSAPTAPAVRSVRLLPERVAEQERRCPDRLALQAGPRGLTFAALVRRARQVARFLMRHGVGVDDVVAVCVLDPLDMVPALLGVLEAGAAYVPLDPTYPEERIAFMCEDSGAQLLLRDAGILESGVSGAWALHGIDLAAARGEEEGPLPRRRYTPESLAYLLYTSGSSGRPKGVMVPHRALASYLAWSARRYGAAEGSGSIVHTPLGFDLTVTSLFAPLVSGARVVLTPLEERVEGFAEALRRERDLSLIKLTPSHLRLLERFLPPAEAEGRARVAVVGGEPLLREHVAFWRRHAPGMSMINEYGPTEAVVGCCVHEVGRQSDSGAQIPIGRPAEGVRISLLDAGLEAVPAGIAGELAVGGASLARGYRARPRHTAEAFVPDPGSEEPGARMYRTGDLAFLDPLGRLVFAGRNDRQVKVRGFRVELGEIESVLARHPEVQETAVVLRAEPGSEGRLIAYVVPVDGAEPAGSELLGWARRSLPDHMVPAAFVPLTEIPLTSHGKVDLEALPEPERTRPDLAVSYAPPENVLQRRLAEIWSDLLQVEEVGIYDNFFDLGGHSYLMFEVHRRVADALGTEVPMMRLFQHPTIAALARFLSSGETAPEDFVESERRGEDRRSSMARQRESRRERRASKSSPGAR